MSPPSSVHRLLISILLIPLACRRAPLLEPAQKTAYLARPAVVRVDAYATARFHYRAASIHDIAALVRTAGADAGELRPGIAEAVVETGAGGSGSGFAVRPDGVIVTSGHVVAPVRDQGKLEQELERNGATAALIAHFPMEALRQLHDRGQLDGIAGRLASEGWLSDLRVTSEVELSTGTRRPFRIVAFSPSIGEHGLDLALLRIPARGLPTMALADSDAVGVGTSVWALGYPAVASSRDDVIGGWLSSASDLEPTFDPGTITAIRRNVNGASLLQTNVAIYPGNSGGPVVDAAGSAVGVSTFGQPSAEQIRFLVPSSAVSSFLREAGLGPAESDFDLRYRRAVASAARGDWTAARRDAGAAAELFPGSPDVIRLSNEVERALAGLPWWQRSPAGAVALVLGGAAAAVIGVRLLARAKQRRRTRARTDIRVLPASRTAVSPTEVSPPGGGDSRATLGRFTILNGERAGEKLGLGGSGIRIGREPECCEIVLENPKVSRLHAEVVAVDGKVLLIDRQSSNGTWVNDRRIDRHILRDGDIIYFGGRNAVAVAFHA